MKTERYAPDYRRNTAISYAKRGQSLISQKQYKEAISEFEKSNQMLKQILEDSSNLSNFDLDNIDPQLNLEEVVEDITTEINRDLSLNYQSMFKIFYALEDYSNCLQYIDKSIAKMNKYHDLKGTVSSLLDTASNYFSAFLFKMYIGNDLKTLEMLLAYLSQMDLAILNDYRFNQQDVNDYTFAASQLFELIKNNPEIDVENILDKHVDFLRNITIHNNYNAFLAWRGFIFNLLNYYLNNDFKWKVHEEDAEILFLDYLYNYYKILETNKVNSELNNFLQELEQIIPKLKESLSIERAVQIFSEASIYFSNQNDFSTAAQLLKDCIEIIENWPELFNDLQLLNHYQNYLSTLNESGQYQKIESVFQKIEALLNSLKWEDSYFDYFNLLEEDLENEINFSRSQVYFNMAVYKVFIKEFDEAKKFIQLAQEYVNRINKDLFLISKIEELETRIHSLKKELENNSDSIFNVKAESEQIDMLVRQVDRALGRVFNQESRLDNKEIEAISLEAFEILNELESFERTRLIVNPNLLLKYYYFTLLLLDKDLYQKEAKDLLKKASTFYTYKNKVDADRMVSILSDLSAFSSHSEAEEYLKQAVDIIENWDHNLQTQDPTLLGNVYYNLAVIEMNSGKNLKDAVENAKRAQYYWKIAERLYNQDLSNQIDMSEKFIHYCENLQN